MIQVRIHAVLMTWIIDTLDPGYAILGQRYVDGSRFCSNVTDHDIYPEMSQLSFDHLLQLSFAFHARRKTGEVLRILDRGAAINHTFEVRARYVHHDMQLNRHSYEDVGVQYLTYLLRHRHCACVLRVLL